MSKQIEIIAKFLEDFARDEDEDRKIAPSLTRLPKDETSWEGFIHSAEKLFHILFKDV